MPTCPECENDTHKCECPAYELRTINPGKPWYGFDHKAVRKRFEGEPEFVGEFSVKFNLKGGGTDHHPCAVYRSQNPNRAKGHKDYLLLWTEGENTIIAGRDESEFGEGRFQDGMKCLRCKDIIYSVARHDLRACTCKAIFIDGGRDYARSGGNPEDYVTVKIDLLKQKVVE